MKFFGKAVPIVCLLFCFFLFVPRVFAATYYVDGANLGGTCDDAGVGTALTTPWCTVQKAASTAVAGDTVNIREFTYRETATMSASGASGNPIIFQKYQNEAPVINGADAVTNWISIGSQESGGVFATGLEIGDTSEFNSTTADSGNTMTAQSSVKNNGSYALQASYAGTAENARANKTLTANNDVYGRIYFRLNSAFDLAATDTIHDILSLREGTTDNRARVSILKNATNQFYIQARIEYPSSVIVYAGTAGEISLDTWHYVELRYKGGDASTGGAEVWLDGVSRGSNYTIDTSGTVVSRMEIGGNSSGLTQPTAGSILYIDDIKASTSQIGAFTSEGNALIYKAQNVNWTVSDVYQDDQRLTEASSVSEIDTSGEWYVDTTNNLLYARTTDNSDPDTHSMDANRRTYGIDLGSRSYITLDGLTVRRTRQTAGAGIVLASSSNITIQNVTSKENTGSGIRLIGSTDNTITGSTFLYNIREFGGGVRLEGGSNNNTISSNTITGIGFNGGNGMFLCGDSDCGSAGNTGNTIRGNTISNVRDTCIYLDTDNDSNTIEKTRCNISIRRSETSGGNGIHIAIGSDNNIIRNNIVSNVERHGISVRDGATPNTGNKIYNNTVYNAGTLSGAGINVQGTNTNTDIKNNVVYKAAAAPINVDSGSTSSTTSDYNILFYGPSVASWGSSNLSSLPAYQALSGQDTHSYSQDPFLKNPSGGDFSLKLESVAINRGTSLSDVLDDFAGIGRGIAGVYDIGAYESTNYPTEHVDITGSSPSGRACPQNAPSGYPDLFQVSTTSTSATLSFAPSGGTFDGYVIRYGVEPGVMQYAVQYDSKQIEGVEQYTINDLTQGTRYYFAVSARNGCTWGEWSQELSAQTPRGRSSTFYVYWYTQQRQLPRQSPTISYIRVEYKQELPELVLHDTGGSYALEGLSFF